MKKYLTKPVLSVVAAAVIAGGLTPLWANASTFGDNATKVVMNAEGKQVTRYNLKELEENDPATLNKLLITQWDHLYIVVEEINLDAKMSTFTEQRKEEWAKIYAEHHDDIYLEVRFDETSDGFVSVKAETKDDKTYITGEVTDDVTKVEVIKSNGDKYEVTPNSDDTFTVSFAAIAGATKQNATVKAYVNDKVVETKEVEINAGTAVEENSIIHTLSTYDATKKELKVNGIVKLDADDVYVTYNGEKKKVDVKKLWQGVGSFSVTFKNISEAKKEALVEAYEDGVKIDSETVDVVTVNAPATTKPIENVIKGTATINAKLKLINVKGSVAGTKKEGKVKLYVVAPDGKKHEVKLSDKAEFTLNINLNNLSVGAKAIQIELYVDGKLVAKKEIPQAKPVNQQPVKVEVKGKEKEKEKEKGKKDKHKGKGHGYGHLKGSKLEWKNEHEDDDDHDHHDGDDHDHEDNDD
jgi:hypothetical protein